MTAQLYRLPFPLILESGGVLDSRTWIAPRIAPSGFLISCASPAPTRPTAASRSFRLILSSIDRISVRSWNVMISPDRSLSWEKSWEM